MNRPFVVAISSFLFFVLLLLAGCSGAGSGGADSSTEGDIGRWAPLAREDRVIVVSGSSPAENVFDLFACSGFGVDDLGSPDGVVVSFGGGTSKLPESSPGEQVDVYDEDLLLATLTVHSDGTLRITPAPGVEGSLELPYTLQNDMGESSANTTVTVEVDPRSPVAVDDAFGDDGSDLTLPLSAALPLWENDDFGAPMATVVGLSLESPITSAVGSLDGYSVGDEMALAGGTVMVSHGGLLVLDGWSVAGLFDFSYEISNDPVGLEGSTAAVTVIVPGPPVAVDDLLIICIKDKGTSLEVIERLNVITGKESAKGDVLPGAEPDAAGYDAALASSAVAVVSYGGLDFEELQGDIGAAVAGPPGSGISVSMDETGDMKVTYGLNGYSPPPGDYQLYYTIANSHGTSEAVVTIRIELA